MTQCVNQKVMSGEHMAIGISQPTAFNVAYKRLGWGATITFSIKTHQV